MITLRPQYGSFCESFLEVSGEPLVLIVQVFKEFVEQPTWRILGTIVCHNWRTPGSPEHSGHQAGFPIVCCDKCVTTLPTGIIRQRRWIRI
jgi:hypothetical protein